MPDYQKGPEAITPASDIGKRVDARRLELHLSRRDLARACGAVIPTFNRRLVSGKLDAAWLQPLAKALHCSVNWILTGKIPRKRRAPSR